MEGMLSARVCGHYEWVRFTVGKIPYSGWGHQKERPVYFTGAMRGHSFPQCSEHKRSLVPLYAYTICSSIFSFFTLHSHDPSALTLI